MTTLADEQKDLPLPLSPHRIPLWRRQLTCPGCKDLDFADPETRAFVPVESGVQPGTPHEATVHWVEGWIVCRKCGHTEWTGESD